MQKIFQEKSKSTFCIRKLYSLVNTNLSKIIKTLNKKQIYSLIIQNAHIIWLLNTQGYSHNDLHGKNIGVIYTKQKYIKILGDKIPILTHGNIFVALDFGNITNKSWTLTEYEKNFKSQDTIRILTRLINYESKINIGPNQYQTNKPISTKDIGLDMMDIIKQTREWYDIDVYIENSNPDDKIILFQILYPEIFQQILFGDKYDKVIGLNYLIDLQDIIYFIKNKSDLKKIIKYFVCKLYGIEINES